MEFIRKNALLGVTVLGVVLFFVLRSRAPVVTSPPPRPPAPPAPVAVAEVPAAPSVADDPGAPAAPETVVEEKKERGVEINPLCPAGKDFVILPSAYLRTFYKNSEAQILLPEKFASCFPPKSDQSIEFFEYDGGKSFPWDPLVSMQAEVKGATAVPSYQDAKKRILERFVGEAERSESEEHFEALERAFPDLIAGPWVLLTLRRDRIEPSPGYWPKAPALHARAGVISAQDFQTMREEPSTKVIDVRPFEEREKRPLPFPAIPAGIEVHGIHRSVLDPANIDKTLALGVGLDDRLILVGRDEYDHAPYNLASNLILHDYRNVFILDGGIPTVSKAFPVMALPEAAGTRITPQDLKTKIKDEKESLLLVDCRNPAAAKGFIEGAARLKMGAGEGAAESFDVSDIQKEIGQRPKLKSIVYIGSSNLDPKPLKVARLLKSRLTAYQVDGGFQAWGFQSHYVWDDHQETKVIPKNLRFAHPPPERVRREVEGPEKVIIEAKPAVVVPPGTPPKK